MNRRPAGVTAVAVVLGIFSALLIFGAAVSGFTAAFFRNVPQPPTATGAPTPPPAGLLSGVALIVIVFYLILAAWGIASTVGLLRMRNWARISTIIIGVGLVLFGLFSMAGTLMAQHMINTAQIPSDQAVSSIGIKALLLIGTLAWVAVAVIGLWWIVYLCIRPTRDSFKFAAGPVPAALGPDTYFYAQPLAPGERRDLTQTDSGYSHLPTEQVFPPAAGMLTPTGSNRRPVSMTVLAVFLFVGAAAALVSLLIPVPSLFFGVVISGAGKTVLSLCWVAIDLYAGYGLLKLQKPAWILAVGFLGLSLINSLLMLVPSYRARLLAYTADMSARMTAGLPGTGLGAGSPFASSFQGTMLVFIAVVGLVFCILLLILLWRARWAYGLAPRPDAAPYPV